MHRIEIGSLAIPNPIETSRGAAASETLSHVPTSPRRNSPELPFQLLHAEALERHGVSLAIPTQKPDGTGRLDAIVNTVTIPCRT